jgi:hypothetical protein
MLLVKCFELGLDEDVLQFVPRPVAAVLLLFPVTSKVDFNFSLSLLYIYLHQQNASTFCRPTYYT